MVAARSWISRQAVAGRATTPRRWRPRRRRGPLVAAVLDHRGQGRRQLLARLSAPRLRAASRRRRRAARSAARRRRRGRRTTRLELRSVQSSRSDDPVGRPAEVGRQRLVEDPEQAALEVHRQPPVLAQRIELDRDAGPAAALAGRAAEGRHQPEVVEDHRPDVEDERLRRLERLLDHRDEQADLALAALRVAADEPLDDLGLEDDVGQALGRARRASPGRSRGGGPPGRSGQPRDGRRQRLRVGRLPAGTVGDASRRRSAPPPRSRPSAVGVARASASR